MCLNHMQVLHPFFDSLLPLDADARIAAVQSSLPLIRASMLQEPHPLLMSNTHTNSTRTLTPRTSSLHPLQQQQQQGAPGPDGSHQQGAALHGQRDGDHGTEGGRAGEGHSSGEGGQRRASVFMGAGIGPAGVSPGDVGALLDDAASLMQAMQGEACLFIRLHGGAACLFRLNGGGLLLMQYLLKLRMVGC